jgi:protein-disulfide isomerase
MRVRETLSRLKKEYPGQIEHVFKHFPLPFHSMAQKASEASECARDQGKFWDMYNKLFDAMGKV